MNGNIPFLYYERKAKLQFRNKHLRDTLDPFNISDRCFIDNYGLPKNLVMNLITDLQPIIDNQQSRNQLKIPLHFEVLVTLSFFASGSYQRCIKLDNFPTMSQSKVSASIARISEALGTKLIRNHIIFPATLAAANLHKTEFFSKYEVPGIVGLIDCTHIAITKLPKKEVYAYVNQENNLSVNTQVICDSKMKILAINARYPGSTHNSYIWGGSKILPIMRRLNLEDNHTWLLGDSAYGLKPYMMVPYSHPTTDRLKMYNKVHTEIYSVIKRCFGVLKSRFRCLNMTTGPMHYSHKRAADIIYSCAVLHNLLIDNNYPIEVVGDEEMDKITPAPYDADEEVNPDHQQNREYLTDYIYMRDCVN